MKLPTSTALATLILIGGISIGGCTTFRDAHGQSAVQPLKFDCSDKLTISDIAKILYEKQLAYQEQPLGDCYAASNLNGKGKDEVLVQLTGSFYSGSGGNAFYIFTRDNGPWQMIADGSQLTYLDSVFVASSKTNGYADLNLRSRDAKSVAMRMQFDGKQYSSVQPR